MAHLVGLGLLLYYPDTYVIYAASPDGRVRYDIPSAVHVLDLSLVLPLLVGTGVMLLRRRPARAVLAVVLLTKMVTLGLALLAMSYAFQSTRSPGEALLWTGIALVSTTLLVLTARRVQRVPGPWMRPAIWR